MSDVKLIKVKNSSGSYDEYNITAQKVGDTTVGSTTNPIYLKEGAPTEITKVGSAASADVATKLGTSSVGTSTKPIYLDAGVPKQIDKVAAAASADTATSATTATTATKLGSATVGSATKPIYLNAGSPTAISNDVVTTDKVINVTATTSTTDDEVASASSVQSLASKMATADTKSYEQFMALDDDTKDNGTVYYVYDAIATTPADSVSYTPSATSTLSDTNVQSALDTLGESTNSLKTTLGNTDISILATDVTTALLQCENQILTNTNNIAINTANIDLKANIASPTFTGKVTCAGSDGYSAMFTGSGNVSLNSGKVADGTSHYVLWYQGSSNATYATRLTAKLDNTATRTLVLPSRSGTIATTNMNFGSYYGLGSLYINSGTDIDVAGGKTYALKPSAAVTTSGIITGVTSSGQFYFAEAGEYLFQFKVYGNRSWVGTDGGCLALIMQYQESGESTWNDGDMITSNGDHTSWNMEHYFIHITSSTVARKYRFIIKNGSSSTLAWADSLGMNTKCFKIGMLSTAYD